MLDRRPDPVTSVINTTDAARLKVRPRHSDAEVGPAELGASGRRDGIAGDGLAPGVGVMSSIRRPLQCCLLGRGLGRVFPYEGRDRGLHLRQHADEDQA